MTPERGRRISTEEALARPALPAPAVLPYGEHPRQTGELRLPGGAGPHPVIVVVHGGCWRAIADRGYMRDVAADLSRHGWATWNLAFRRSDDPGGGWPGTFTDVAAGADHLRQLATETPLDLARVATLGHSSGGHLALWLAGRGRIPAGAALSSPDPVPLCGVVAVGGITELAGFHALDRRACVGGVESLLGAHVDGAGDRLAVADPGRLLPLGVPQLLVHGVDDPDVPVTHVRAYAARASEAGDDVELAEVAEAGHFEVVAPWWEGWPEVRGRILRFLDRTCAGEG